MDEDSNSYVKDITSLIPDISKVVSAAPNATPMDSYSNKTSKANKDIAKTMDGAMSQGSANFMLEVRNSPNSKKNLQFV